MGSNPTPSATTSHVDIAGVFIISIAQIHATFSAASLSDAADAELAETKSSVNADLDGASNHLAGKRKDQTQDHPTLTLAS